MTCRLALLLPALVLGCGGDAPRGPAESEYREPGLYEVTTQLGDVSGAGLAPGEEAELRAMLGNLPPEKQCLLGGKPKVGDPFQGGRCSYSRVADSGTRAERSVSCPSRGGGSVDSFEISGTTRSDGYSLRIVSRRSEAGEGRALREVETFEVARRLGPCPQ